MAKSEMVQVNFEIPELESLKAQFKVSADVSRDGKTVKIGDLTAQAGAYPYNHSWEVSSDNKNDGLFIRKVLIGTDFNGVTDFMAEHEAEKHLPEGAKERALADALEKKAREIRIKGVSFG